MLLNDNQQILNNTKWYYMITNKKNMKKTMWIVVFFSSVGENPDNSWWCLKIPGDTWKYLVIPDNTSTIPNNTKQNKTILNNSKQYLTNLETVGIIWYHQYIKYDCQYDTSIILVPSRYGTGGFVSLWYHHNTDSGNCQKNFYALSLRRFALPKAYAQLQLQWWVCSTKAHA